MFQLPVLTSLGKYSWKSSIWWDSDSEGATNITLGDVAVHLDASLSVGKEGALRLTEDSTKVGCVLLDLCSSVCAGVCPAVLYVVVVSFVCVCFVLCVFVTVWMFVFF